MARKTGKEPKSSPRKRTPSRVSQDKRRAKRAKEAKEAKKKAEERLCKLDQDAGTLISDAAMQHEGHASIGELLRRWLILMRDIETLNRGLQTKGVMMISINSLVGLTATAITAYIQQNMKTLRKLTKFTEEPRCKAHTGAVIRDPTTRCDGECVCCQMRGIAKVGSLGASLKSGKSAIMERMKERMENSKKPTPATKRAESISHNTDFALRMFNMVALDQHGALPCAHTTSLLHKTLQQPCVQDVLVFLLKCFGRINVAIHDDVENASRKMNARQSNGDTFEDVISREQLVEDACYYHRLHSSLCLILETIERVVDRCAEDENLKRQMTNLSDSPIPHLLWSAVGFLRMPGQRSAARLVTVRIVRKVLQCFKSLSSKETRGMSKAIADARPRNSPVWSNFFMLGETREHYPSAEVELAFQLYNLDILEETHVKTAHKGHAALGSTARHRMVAAAGLPHLAASLVGHYSSVDDSPGLHGTEWNNTQYILAGVLGINEAVKEFNILDENGDGRLSIDELKPFISRFESEFGKNEDGLDGLLHEMDRDGNGVVSLQEFVQWCQQKLVQHGGTLASFSPSDDVDVSVKLDDEALKLLSLIVDPRVHRVLQDVDGILLHPLHENATFSGEPLAAERDDQDQDVEFECLRCNKALSLSRCECWRVHAPSRQALGGSRRRKSSNTSHVEEVATIPLLPADLSTAMFMLIPRMMVELTIMHDRAIDGNDEPWPVGDDAKEIEHIVDALRIKERLREEMHRLPKESDVRRSLQELQHVFDNYAIGVFARSSSSESYTGTYECSDRMRSAYGFAKKVASCIAAWGSVVGGVGVRTCACVR